MGTLLKVANEGGVRFRVNGVATGELKVGPRGGDGNDAEKVAPETKSSALTVLHKDFFLVKGQKSIGAMKNHDPAVDEEEVARDVEGMERVAVT